MFHGKDGEGALPHIPLRLRLRHIQYFTLFHVFWTQWFFTNFIHYFFISTSVWLSKIALIKYLPLNLLLNEMITNSASVMVYVFYCSDISFSLYLFTTFIEYDKTSISPYRFFVRWKNITLPIYLLTNILTNIALVFFEAGFNKLAFILITKVTLYSEENVGTFD